MDRFVCAAHQFRYAGGCTVQRTADGRPTLLSGEGEPLDRRCSISHTGNWLTCIFSEKEPVGVDLEVTRARDYVSIGAWFFGAELGARLKSASPTSQKLLFYQAWTAYEALYKCGVNKRRKMAPLLPGATQDNVPGIALRWLTGPRELLVCVAVLGDAAVPAPSIAVFRQDGVEFAPDTRWSSAPVIDHGGDYS